MNRYVAIVLSILAGVVWLHGEVTVGAARQDMYLPLLRDARVGLFSNHTGMVGNRHTADLLLEAGVNLTALFSPEHGFRGDADAGEQVASDTDRATGLPVYSLYGASRKESLARIADVDVMVVDIQDVGLRFYTYYCTMLEIMEQAAATGARVVVLDRPNPNGMYVDGPVLDMRFSSGVGRLPIPVVHGLTLGELAQMAIGEGWMKNPLPPQQLEVVPCQGYTHATRYSLPIAPSPNLPTMHSIYLYPSVCLFEATPVSLGRGTDFPFEVYGHPGITTGDFTFVPQSRPGAKRPPQLGNLCRGRDLRGIPDEDVISAGLDLGYLIEAYRALGSPEKFFTSFFEKLIGVDYVRPMIERGCSAAEIKARWADDVKSFKERRRQYLLYPEN